MVINVQVLQQTESGWWFVKIGGEEGWAPSTFIEARQPIRVDTGHRDSGSSLGSLDEETGEKNRKGNKLSIGSSNGAFTPVSPRPLPSIPAEDEGNYDETPEPLPKPARKPPPDVPTKSTNVNNIAALRLQLEQKLNTRDNDGGGAPPPTFPRRTSEGVVQQKPALPVKRVAKEQWKTVSSYDSENDTEVSFREGARVEVIEKDDSGWWLIKVGPKEGWAPSTFLEKC